LYVIPITEKTIEFCSSMGVLPVVDHSSVHPHMFAYFAHIKHNMYNLAEKINISRNRTDPSLNPTV